MIKNIVKGFIIGVAKIIPGVSGSSMAIIFGVYEKAINILANVFKIDFKSFLFLLEISIGVLFGICLFSRCVKWLLMNFYFSIMLLFIGLIVGGIKIFFKEIKCNVINTVNNWLRYILLFFLSFFLVIFLSLFTGSVRFNINDGNYLIYVLLGIIEVFSSLIPGISGTAIYMILGCYEIMLEFFGNLFLFSNLKFMLLFSFGILIGTILISKMLVVLFKYFRSETYVSILGFMIGSTFIMFKQAFICNFSILEFIIGIILFVLGYKFTINITAFFEK